MMLLARDLLPFLQHEQHAVVRLRRTQAVDAAHAGDDHAIAALEQRSGRGEPQLVQLVVDGGFLFDVDVARRHVRFRLVIIVIADEVLDRVVREERSELAVELRGQSLVVRQHQRGPADGFDHLGHGERLARPGDAQQHLVLLAVLDSAQQFLDGGLLIAARAVVHRQTKAHSFSIGAVSLVNDSSGISSA